MTKLNDDAAIRKFMANMILSKFTPVECLSLGSSIITTVIAHVRGNDVAEKFVTSYNKLLAETLDLDLQVNVRVGGNQS